MRKNLGKLLIALLPIVTPFTISCSSSNSDQTIHFTEVIDGDTFKYDQEKYRLFGVDTPELHDQYHDFKVTTGIEYIYAFRAKEFASNFLTNHQASVHIVTTDRYHRHVAKIESQGNDLAILLLMNGLARVAYINLIPGNPFKTDDYEYYRKLLDAQLYAFKRNIGLWQQKNRMNDIFTKG